MMDSTKSFYLYEVAVERPGEQPQKLSFKNMTIEVIAPNEADALMTVTEHCQGYTIMRITKIDERTI